jgi:hypothetical protein
MFVVGRVDYPLGKQFPKDAMVASDIEFCPKELVVGLPRLWPYIQIGTIESIYLRGVPYKKDLGEFLVYPGPGIVLTGIIKYSDLGKCFGDLWVRIAFPKVVKSLGQGIRPCIYGEIERSGVVFEKGFQNNF